LGLEESTSKITVYPNPFSTKFQLQGYDNLSQMELFSSDGKRIDFILTNISNTCEIEVRGEPGVYFLYLDNQQIIKLIKQ
jgi:hypothetical protein